MDEARSGWRSWSAGRRGSARRSRRPSPPTAGARSSPTCRPRGRLPWTSPTGTRSPPCSTGCWEAAGSTPSSTAPGSPRSGNVVDLAADEWRFGRRRLPDRRVPGPQARRPATGRGGRSSRSPRSTRAASAGLAPYCAAKAGLSMLTQGGGAGARPPGGSGSTRSRRAGRDAMTQRRAMEIPASRTTTSRTRRSGVPAGPTRSLRPRSTLATAGG